MLALKYYVTFLIDEPIFISGKVKEVLKNYESQCSKLFSIPYLTCSKLFSIPTRDISNTYDGTFETLSTSQFYKFIQDILNVLPEDKRQSLEIYIDGKKVDSLSIELLEYYRDLKAKDKYFSIDFYFNKEYNFYYMKLGVFPIVVDLF